MMAVTENPKTRATYRCGGVGDSQACAGMGAGRAFAAPHLLFHLISGETVSLAAVRKTTLKQMGGTVPETLSPDPNMDSLIAAFLVKAASGEFAGQSRGKKHQLPSVDP